MSAQINIKMDEEIKKQVQQVAKALGFSLSDLTRAFYMNLIRTKQVHFSLEDNWNDDTPDDLTGEKLKKQLIDTGYSKKYAKRHAEAYDRMLDDEKNDRLIRM